VVNGDGMANLGIAYGKTCKVAGSFGADSSGAPLVCTPADDGISYYWGTKYYVSGTGGSNLEVKSGNTCTTTGTFATDASGTPLVCKGGYWMAGLPVSSEVWQSKECSHAGETLAGTDGKPYVCTERWGKLLWTRSDKIGFEKTVMYNKGEVDSTFNIPPEVETVWVSMAGGGQSGAYTDVKPINTYVNIFPGGSGAYVLDRPIPVQGGKKLCIYVGKGGTPVGSGPFETNHIGNKGYSGGASMVWRCDKDDRSFTGIRIFCAGGGSDSPGNASANEASSTEAGTGGSGCIEYTDEYGWSTISGESAFATWVSRQGSYAPGGRTPLPGGHGGAAGRCWGSCYPGQDYGGVGYPGSDGVVILRWYE
jgi:hypothetical protein